MTKKTYLRPTADVVEVKSVQLVCASLKKVNSSGLDDEEELYYGDGDTKEENIWNKAW